MVVDAVSSYRFLVGATLITDVVSIQCMILLTAFEVARFDEDVAVRAIRARYRGGTRISNCIIEVLLAMRARTLR